MPPLPNNFTAEVVIMSDIHLVSCEDERGKRLLQILDQLSESQVQTLILLGDIFDFCLGSSTYFQNKFAAIGDRLEKLAQQGVNVIFFEGNHEFKLQEIGWRGVQFIAEGDFILNVNRLKIKFAHGDLIYSTWHYRWFRAFVKSTLVTKVASLLPGRWMDQFATKSAQISRAQDQYRRIHHQLILESANRWLTEGSATHGIFGHFHVPYAEKAANNRGMLLGLDSWDIPNLLMLKEGTFWRYKWESNQPSFEPAQSFFSRN